MSDLPKITAHVTVTIDRGNGEVTTVTETVRRSPAVLPVSYARERQEADRAIKAASERVFDRVGGGL